MSRMLWYKILKDDDSSSILPSITSYDDSIIIHLKIVLSWLEYMKRQKYTSMFTQSISMKIMPPNRPYVLDCKRFKMILHTFRIILKTCILNYFVYNFLFQNRILIIILHLENVKRSLGTTLEKERFMKEKNWIL